MHFRTLDWGLDGLRDMLVVLEFVQSNSCDPKKVIGKSITYAGYVGILTGVRENFSLSMNFRPKSKCSKSSLYFHQFLVLTGFRPSISTIFRSLIIAPIGSTLPSIIEASQRMSRDHVFSPCYVILCDGCNTLVVEKDLHSSSVRSSPNFIIQANHDILQWQLRTKLHDHDLNPFPTPRPINPYPAPPLGPTRDDPKVFKKHQQYWDHENSEERYYLLRRKWTSLPDKVGSRRSVDLEHLKNWIRTEPINCTQTHFMCLLDPAMGQIQWLERGMESNYV
ncbi:hypothetical protein DSL72_007584 [Monilinia vaccinii-corymbosi]|uniref:ceramidase n=1 Tax=Monilinia vaccinii-corymbosi TaxID=61207 RepID=A0A8A3PI63_9HELO|nr:hypothetical protein DSL72_007584 [Monilinia vaccinii-corymbosi]